MLVYTYMHNIYTFYVGWWRFNYFILQKCMDGYIIYSVLNPFIEFMWICKNTGIPHQWHNPIMSQWYTYLRAPLYNNHELASESLVFCYDLISLSFMDAHSLFHIWLPQPQWSSAFECCWMSRINPLLLNTFQARTRCRQRMLTVRS